MKVFFYNLFSGLSKRLGNWIFRVFAWIVATGYFILFPGRVATSVRFYKALFPEKHFVHHLGWAWTQYHNFTSVYMDRLFLQDASSITCTREGWEYLQESIEKGTGGILLMSHMGSWEIAAHLLKTKGARLLLYLGEKHKEQIERKQKQSLGELGIKIITVAKDGGSPFDIVEGIQFLKDGGLVSLTGDRIWHESQKTIAVNFLGHQVLLPESPHVFALLSGAPLFVFFIQRTGERSYHLIVSKPVYVRASSRNERSAAVLASAQAYADLLENAVRKRPGEWYHFEQFLEPKQNS